MSQNGHTSHVSRLHPTASAAGGSLGMLGHNPRSTAVNNRNNNSNMNHTNSSPAAASWNASQVDANQNNVAGLATTHHHPGAAPGTPSGGDYETKETVHPSPESSSSSQSGTTLKEHDLLGLSDVSSSVTRQENSAQDSSFQSEEINLNLNLGATELRLGLQDARKVLDSEFQRQRSGAVGTPEQGTSSASETGNFLGGLDGGGKGADHGALVSDRRSSNSDQYTSISEQQQQQVLERRFSYGPLTGERGPPTPQGGRADVLEGTVCKPLIESESLQKWHSGLERNMVSNESLRLGMSLPLSKRALNQEDVTEQLFFNSADKNYQDNTTQEVKQHQHQLVSEEHHHHPLGYQDRSWQERNQHNLGQEDVSSTERAGTQERPMSDRVPLPLDQQQQVGEKGEQQDRLKHEPFHTEKRNLQEGNKTLAAPQQPEPRFVQELSSALPERSPRHSSDYGQNLWHSQVLRPAEFHTQQQMPSHPAQQEDSSRTGYPGPLVGGFPGPGSRVSFGPSKPGVSGAKRSFDTIGISSDARNFDARAGLPSPVTGTSAVIPSNTSSSDADVKSKSQQPPLYQSWGTKATPPWQMLQHSGGSFGPFPSQAPGRNPAMPVMNNHPTAEAASAGGDPAQKAWEAQTKSLQEPAASSLPQKMSNCPSETKPVAAQASSPATEAVSAPRATAPPANAVGWPPLRSFRKSTLASQNRPSPVETNPRPPPPSSTQAASPASVASQPNSYFVKVYMDGVPIGRKVDLKAYSSYEKLSLVLEDMFRGFVNGQQSGQGGRDMTAQTDKRSFFRGTDYVLTYEDQEGDLMLVGDVPWMLFLETVKRLRIMKGSEAIGLGSRAGARVAAEKVNKTQHSV